MESFVSLNLTNNKNKKLNEISIKNVTYWLGTQNKPISELYIDENGKNKVVEIENWNGNSFFDKFYKVQNFFPYAIPIVLDNEPPRM
ncbi:hypothetical protein [Enterococcus faecium]|uniref:hypothetical protein n=1 Tax=Enterococcus faecium TaxID=1352 RepID=UPI0022EBD014|nr:hypothetical protein [Enterococcus faecium]